MVLLTTDKISKSYSEKKLLNEISFSMNEGDKVGVIGINGTGKSTFLKIIAGLEEPDKGILTKSRGVRVGYLPQNPTFEEGLTILEQVFKNHENTNIKAKEYEVKSVLNKLGINDFDKQVSQLSGGEKKRVALASVLVSQYEILVMDEPTNHLDNEMVTWLEEYLTKYTGSIIMVTHDRYFLDRVTNKIIELTRGDLFSCNCNYGEFIRLKSERLEMELSTERKNKSIYKKELNWIMRGPRGRGTKSRSRIERFDELENRRKPVDDEKLELGSVASRLGKKTIELEGIHKSYGNRTIIKDFSYIILRDARVGIVGKNGCGKSTLLKIIVGEIQPSVGEVIIGDTVKVGYFTQDTEEMDNSLRVIDYIKNIAEIITTEDGTVTASQMLERFLFPGDLQYNTIGKLSGGERRRLYLLSILMKAPNILMLDEPTNDLDIETLTVLEDYLDSFSGAVVVVSHDRYFLDRVVDRIFEYQEDGGLKEYLGGYTDYFDQKQEEVQATETVSKQSKSKDLKKDRTVSETNRKLKFTFKEQYEFERIDDEIEELENKKTNLQNEINESSNDYIKLQELLNSMKTLEKDLDDKTERWVYLHELAEKIEKQ